MMEGWLNGELTHAIVSDKCYYVDCTFNHYIYLLIVLPYPPAENKV
jgi:hypothetical protein